VPDRSGLPEAVVVRVLRPRSPRGANSEERCVQESVWRSADDGVVVRVVRRAAACSARHNCVVTHTGTDLSTLALPPAARKALAWSRSKSIDDHAVAVPTAWWNAALAHYRLPGGPVVGHTGRDETTRISRAQLFDLASDAGRADEHDVLRLLWHVLAWGSGFKLRHNHKRLRGIAEKPAAAVATLRAAACLARTDPQAAYAQLYRVIGTPVPHLGPAFFTKYLYFTGAGLPAHPCAILDSRVAYALHTRCGWTSLHSGGNWPPCTYQRYCTLLVRWAAEESARSGWDVGPDETERWLFGA
jgi:hypothetical protein